MHVCWGSTLAYASANSESGAFSAVDSGDFIWSSSSWMVGHANGRSPPQSPLPPPPPPPPPSAYAPAASQVSDLWSPDARAKTQVSDLCRKMSHRGR